MALPFAQQIGGAVGAVGGALHLPELGISEAIQDPRRSVFSANPNNLTTFTNSPSLTGQQSYGGGIAANNPQVLGAETGNATTSASNGTVGNTGLTQAQINAQQSQIDQGLGRLGTQASVGNNNILNSYNSAFQTLTNAKAQALGQLGTQRQNTINDNITAKAGVDDSVRAQNTNLQRLLGAAGAGNSSAASILAPYAAALQGNAQRAGIQGTYAKNLGIIDQDVNNTNNQYDTSFGDLAAQRDAETNKLNAGIDTTRAQLLQQRANLLASQGQNYGAVQSQIGSLLNAADQLGAVPTFTPKAVAYTAPDLAAYNVGQTTAPSLAAAGSAAAPLQNAGVYYNLLTGDDKKNALLGAS